MRDSLDVAVWVSTALGLAAWQLLIGVLGVLRSSAWSTALLAADVALLGVAVVLVVGGITRRGAGRSWHPLAAGAFYTFLVTSVAAQVLLSDDALVATVAVMSTAPMAATPFLLLPWRSAAASTWLPVAGTAVVLLERGQPALTLAVVVPTLLYSVGSLVLIALVRGFAGRADADGRAAAAEAERLARAQASARADAELSRVVHDTAVNTLSFLATPGRLRADPAAVRRRCAADVDVLRRLRQGVPRALDLAAVGRDLDLEVHWTGDPVPDARALVALVGEQRAEALCAITRELLLNVAKHAEVERASVETRVEDSRVVVTVADEGRGFVPSVLSGRGLGRSVLSRADENGVEVDLSSAPGAGTRAVLWCGPAEEADAPEPTSGRDAARDLLVRIAQGWCVALPLIGLLVTATGSPTPASLGSVLLVGGLSAWAWMAFLRRGRITPAPLVALVAGVPVAHVLAFAGASAPGGDPASWQAIGLTPLLVLLVVVARSRVGTAVAVVSLVSVAAAVGTATWPTDQLMGGLVVANALMQLSQVTVWLVFTRTVTRMSETAARSRRLALRDVAATARLESLAAARLHGLDQHLDHVVTLMASIAAGDLDPADPDVARRAGEEAHVLRQLIDIDPELVHLGPWLVRTLLTARERGVELTVRSGCHDLAGPDAATAVGQALEALVDQVPRGSSVVIAYFGGDAHPDVTVVGPHGSFDVGQVATDGTEGLSLRVTPLLDQDLVEVVQDRSSLTPATVR